MKRDLGFLKEWTGLALASAVLVFMIGFTIYEDAKPPTGEWAEKYQRLIGAKLDDRQFNCLRSKADGVEKRHAKKLDAKKEIQAHLAQCHMG